MTPSMAGLRRAAGASEQQSSLSVGLVCSEYPAFMPQHGGIGSFVHSLAHALVNSGHRATVYGFGEREGTSTDGDVTLQLLRRADFWTTMRSMQSRLAQDLRRGAIDIAEAAEAEAHCLPSRPGTVVRLHGGHHFWCATLPQRKRYGQLALEQYAIRRADGLCAVSQFAADLTRRAMHLRRRPIAVIPNPVDTGLFAPNPAAVTDASILFVGAITEKKGVRELCAAMAGVRRRHPEARLQLVGRDIQRPDGAVPLRVEIERTLAPEVAPAITFVGPRSRPDVARLMAAAHVCVFPSHMETQGIVLLEAMASGRPVVASIRGPGREVLGADGECGFLVDPANPVDIEEKICRVLDDATAAARMGARGRDRAVEHFSLDACLRSNLSFFRDHLYHP